jgi:hypothetical protein
MAAPARSGFEASQLPKDAASQTLVRQPSAHAADRVFLDCRVAGILVRRACRTGPSPRTAKLIAGYGAGGEREPRPGRPDAAGARGPGSGMAGRPAGCLETLGDPGQGTDARPGSPASRGSGRRPGSPGTSRWSRPARSRVAGVREGTAARRARALPHRHAE